jgi:hypothetical protein
MVIRSVWLSVLVVSVALAGCSRPSKFVGTWESQIFNATARKIERKTFNPDKSYKNVVLLTTPLSKATLTATDVGSWKAEGPDIYSAAITDTDWTPDGAAKNRLDAARKKFLADKSKLLDDAVQSNALVAVKWINNDAFSVQEGGAELTYHRVK